VAGEAGDATSHLDRRKESAYALTMDSDTIDFTACRQCACSAARRKSRELTRFYDETMRRSGVRVSQFNLLATLIQTGPMAATRLAGFLGLERTTLTRNLRPLLRDGLVILEDDADRRVHKIAITPKGAAAARTAFPFWRKAQDATLAIATDAQE
jgi:DNA-binding MarR family transcriptional regulator